MAGLPWAAVRLELKSLRKVCPENLVLDCGVEAPVFENATVKVVAVVVHSAPSRITQDVAGPGYRREGGWVGCG